MVDLKTVIKSQYHASLATLGQFIDRCPQSLWLQVGPQPVACWQIVYHTLYFTELYLQISEKHFKPFMYADHPNFKPWKDMFHDLSRTVKNKGKLPEGLSPYTLDQMQNCWQAVDDRVDACVDQMDLDSENCGFHWYAMGKFEHQFVNIRHIQHHAAQLADRLRVGADLGTDWVAKG